MPSPIAGQAELDELTREFYLRTLLLLNTAEVPYLVGGAYALGHYAGIERHTKDFDIFVHRRDYDRVMHVLACSGCKTELTFPHWLGKAHCADGLVDVIFSSGNGIASVDDEWFERAVEGEVLGMPVLLCPPEEIIWSKAFIMERERFDGADIMHLLLVCGPELDWDRLLRRFGAHWRVLLFYLVLFGYIYPAERAQVPEWVMRELLARLQDEMREPAPSERVCRGTILSREQYLVDIECWQYLDARLGPEGGMTHAEVAHWTAAINGTESRNESEASGAQRRSPPGRMTKRN